PSGAGQRRRSQGHGAAVDAGGGHSLRYLLRRGDARRRSPGREAGNAGQDDRCGAAGFG
nr:hypothetical protein [Tanacetum cinerariifolium]